MQYLRIMNFNEQFSDHITLQAMSELFNLQVIVVSTLNHGTILIRPDGSSRVADEQACVVLGHMYECNVEHYVCLGADRDDLRGVVAASQQITWASSNDDDCDNEELVDVGLVPGREIHDDDCDNEELMNVGLAPGRKAHDTDCGDEELVDGDCQHINEVFDAVPGLIDDDNNDVMSSLSVIPNEIVAYIIHLVLLSVLTI